MDQGNNSGMPSQRPNEDLNVPPTSKVIAMRNQGLSNNEIIQTLQRSGYESNIILDAMNQADVKHRIENFPPRDDDNSGNIENQMQFPSGNQDDDNSAPFPPNPNFQQAGNDFSAPPQNSQQMPSMDFAPPEMPSSFPSDMQQSNVEQISIERIEEIAEAIIDEKWNEIVRSINKIIDWKERTETNITRLEQRFTDLKKEFDNLSQGVLGKIGDYDKNLNNLGVEIKAMERVFQNIIPSLTENVHTLEKITGRMKGQQ